MIRHVITSTLALLCFAAQTLRSDTPDSPEARVSAAREAAASLKYQQGDITLRGDLARIKVPAEFRYLNPADAATVITKIWGNPPTGDRTLGMLVPAEIKPTDPDGWGVIITFEEDGYVKDDEASKIDYTKLLKQMQDETRETNQLREKKGYPPVELVGWAVPPRYDADAHKLYWAKELRFEGSGENTLNYNIRMLGRRGVLVLNAVAGMGQLPDVQKATPAILSMVDFQDGHRYADFNPKTDKVAAYGIAALVAGGVLAKAGFFKVLIGAILALKKVLVVAVIALFSGAKALLGKIFGARRPTTEDV